MASRKTQLVDGFTAIRAAQEAARHGRGDPVRPDAKDDSTTEASHPDAKAGTRIGRSVMPSKREVICPECGASTEVTGMVQLFVCNICRHRMKLEDVKIPEGEWDEELEVGGTVIVPTGAVLTGGKIVANDVILQGKMEGCEIRATRLMTIGSDARPDWVRLQALDLELGMGVNLTPGKPIEGRNLLLHGKFSGRAILTGKLTIFADGDFSGQIRASGLDVHEGGGLRAQMDINPEYKPEPPKQQRRAPPAKVSKLREPPPPARGKAVPAKKKAPLASKPSGNASATPAKKAEASKKAPAKKAPVKKKAPVNKKAAPKKKAPVNKKKAPVNKKGTSTQKKPDDSDPPSDDRKGSSS